MAETLLAEDLRAVEQRSQYDAAVKRLLANKEILARILKGCVREYQNCTVPEILQCIEGTPQLGKVLVHTDEEISERIHGISDEDAALYEGTVRYDIRFQARLPMGKGSLGLIINIEAQRHDHPGYPLVKRGIYYCSRMISSQYGTVFADSHYGKIRKVYSIWICEHPAQKRKNSIVQYEMDEKIRFGNSIEDPMNYDLLSVIMVYMGIGDEKQQEELIRILDVLLSPKYTLTTRKQILQEEFGLAMTRKMEGEVQEMCNLSLNIYEKGIEQGIVQGIEQGMEKMLLDNIHTLIQNMHCPVETAMDILNVPEDKREFVVRNIALSSES